MVATARLAPERRDPPAQTRLRPGDRRQVPFDRYFVDFYCHAAKLVVELDGKQHAWFAGYDAG